MYKIQIVNPAYLNWHDSEVNHSKEAQLIKIQNIDFKKSFTECLPSIASKILAKWINLAKKLTTQEHSSS